MEQKTSTPEGKSESSKRWDFLMFNRLTGAFLYIEHEGSRYIGCLLIDDRAFCHQIVKLLQAQCNHSIAEIGNIDVSYPLAAWIENKICPVMSGQRTCGLQTFWRGVFDESLEPSFDVYVCAKGHETYFLSSEK